MTQCLELLNQLHHKGVYLWLDDDDRLRYRCSAGALLPTDLDGLRSMKQEVMAVLGHRRSAAAPAEHDSTAAGTAPLTVQQGWLWNAMERGAANHLIPHVFRLSGPFRPELLSKSCDMLFRRHSALRTRIVLADGNPTQHADELASSAPVLQFTDISRLSERERDERVWQTVDHVWLGECDLSRGPLFEVRLLKLAHQEHVFILSAHHIIADAFAFTLMLREIWLTYRAYCQEQSPPLQHAPMQYVSYARWQQQTLRLSEQSTRAYWRERLAGASAIRSPLGTDATGRTAMEHRVAISFERELSERLRKLAADSGATLAMAMLALYAALLSRWCQQRDFVLAIIVSGRDRPELERMAGYCASALYLRIAIGKETFGELSRKVSEEFGRALAHGDFGRAVAEHPELHAHTLFQWISWPLDEPGEVLAPLNVKTRWLPTKIVLDRESPFAQYASQIALWEVDGTIAGAVHCPATASTTAEEFVRALHTFAEEVCTSASACA